MKKFIVGISASAPGAVSKAGKSYSIAQVHTMSPLAPPRAEGAIEKGEVGRSYPCDQTVVRKIAHLPFPFWAEVEVEEVMVFGKPESTCVDVKPIEVARKAA